MKNTLKYSFILFAAALTFAGCQTESKRMDEHHFDNKLYLVDLPGYGYARVSRTMIEDWGAMMDSYLSGSEHLCHILHLVDIRHDPGENDIQMQAWIQHNNLPCTVIATKSDKLSRAQQQKAILGICRTLGVQPWDVIPFSSVTRDGKDKLLTRLGEIIRQAEGQA